MGGGEGRYCGTALLYGPDRTDQALDSLDRWIRSMSGTAEHEPQFLDADYKELRRRVLILRNRIEDELPHSMPYRG